MRQIKEPANNSYSSENSISWADRKIQRTVKSSDQLKNEKLCRRRQKREETVTENPHMFPDNECYVMCICGCEWDNGACVFSSEQFLSYTLIPTCNINRSLNVFLTARAFDSSQTHSHTHPPTTAPFNVAVLFFPLDQEQFIPKWMWGVWNLYLMSEETATNETKGISS